MADTGYFEQLRDVINQEWFKIYGGEPVQDVFALKMRVMNLAEDRSNWAFNCRVLQNSFNDLEKRYYEATGK